MHLHTRSRVSKCDVYTFPNAWKLLLLLPLPLPSSGGGATPPSAAAAPPAAAAAAVDCMSAAGGEGPPGVPLYSIAATPPLPPSPIVLLAAATHPLTHSLTHVKGLGVPVAANRQSHREWMGVAENGEEEVAEPAEEIQNHFSSSSIYSSSIASDRTPKVSFLHHSSQHSGNRRRTRGNSCMHDEDGSGGTNRCTAHELTDTPSLRTS
eukprot:GHVU01129210.1.p1 GENE.GHVU01129210.1~~GHVU01129210.1.p1  ORF type:complete len:208 (-),score=41.73 GHVU01129210.1:438-1061(-)